MACFTTEWAARRHYYESLGDLMEQARRAYDSIGGKDMKCEICGAESGKWQYVADLDIPIFGLCPDHYDKVVAYIESLKPKYKVTRREESYRIEPLAKGGRAGMGYDSSMCGGTAAIVDLWPQAADALYEYMRREKRGEI